VRPIDGKRIKREIVAAERGTTGRIGVRVIPDTATDALEAARKHFHDAGLHCHPDGNAVIFLVAPKARRFAVYGGEAIYDRIGGNFWSGLIADMEPYFAKDRATEALALGITRVGNELRRYFPSALQSTH
jgi:uncharacterized membrane protein